MKTVVQLRSKAFDPEVEALVGTQASAAQAAVKVAGNVTVYKPNGDLLLVLLKGALSEAAADAAYPFLHWLRKYKSFNRGNYAAGAVAGFDGDNREKVSNDGSSRYRPIKRDGSLSNTTYARPVRSAVVGNMDRYPRIPYCRQCALSAEKPEAWGACLPLIQEAGRLFRQEVTTRFAAQLDMAKKTHPAYVIPGTPFTTLTVNNTVAGGYHRDAGDFKPGFGVMSVLRRGSYRGCELVVPAYGVSVDLEDRDLVLFDVHELHGNTPFYDAVGPEGEPEKGGHERISIVFYYRQKMHECLSPAEELEHAKARGNLIREPEDQGEPS